MSATVLITGCSSGNGRETARAFLADGWHVYATARDTDDLAELAAAGASTAELDVTSEADVQRVVDRVVDERGRIDCLVNNAGFGQMGPVEDVSTEKLREQYDVNIFGPHRLTRAVLPYMRDRGRGRIVNVTSITDRYPLAGTAAYSGSKSALATESRALRQEVASHGIDVVVVEPTVVATDFYDRVREELVDVDHRAAYTDLYELLELLHTVKSGGPGIVSPEAVAETILEAATTADPANRYEVGTVAKLGAAVAAVLPNSWQTPLLRFAVRLSTSGPVRRIFQQWFARHHRATPVDERRGDPIDESP